MHQSSVSYVTLIEGCERQAELKLGRGPVRIAFQPLIDKTSHHFCRSMQHKFYNFFALLSSQCMAKMLP